MTLTRETVIRRSVLVSLLGMIGWMAAPAPAQACGGFFCDRPPPNPLDPLPVAQAGENVVFGVEGDPASGNAVVTAHIQILYSGDAALFSWVVPVLSVPTLSTGTDRLFSSLAGVTQPIFVPQSAVNGVCLPGPSVLNDSATAGTATGLGGSAGAAGPPRVNVLFQGAVGPYDAATLQSSDSAELKTWLTDHGYYVDPHAGQIIDTYVQEGKYFVALRLSNGQDVRSIRPIVLTFHGTEPCVPLRLTAIAALPDMPVTVYLLGGARAVPLGFLELKLDELRIDWPSQGSNYAALLGEAANDAGGNAFVTEYAGPSNIASQLLWSPGRFNAETLRAALTPADYVQALIGQGLANDAQTLPLLIKYIPMPDAAISAGITPAMFYANLALYSAQYPLPPSDLGALTDEVVTGIIEPRRLAQAMIDGHPYLTRFGTFLSPEEMNQDPLFTFNDALPDVPSRHTSVLRTMCGNFQYLACNAPVRLELPDGRMAWLRSGIKATSCQPPRTDDASLTSLPAAEMVWRRGTIGEGTVQIDNVAKIQSALTAHNASFDPSGARADSGCGCAVARGRSSPVLGLAGVALALVSFRARRRPRRDRARRS